MFLLKKTADSAVFNQAPRLYKKLYSTQLSIKIFLLIKVKMPSIDGIFPAYKC